MKKSGVDGAKSSRIRTDPECDGQQSYCGEAGIPQHHFEAVAKILKDRFHCEPRQVMDSGYLQLRLRSPAGSGINEIICKLIYSYLSAIIGSTLVARRAGTRQATSATLLNKIAVAANVSGSVAVIPYRKLANSLVNPNAPPIPITTPIIAGAMP